MSYKLIIILFHVIPYGGGGSYDLVNFKHSSIFLLLSGSGLGASSKCSEISKRALILLKFRQWKTINLIIRISPDVRYKPGGSVAFVCGVNHVFVIYL